MANKLVSDEQYEQLPIIKYVTNILVDSNTISDTIKLISIQDATAYFVEFYAKVANTSLCSSGFEVTILGIEDGTFFDTFSITETAGTNVVSHNVFEGQYASEFLFSGDLTALDFVIVKISGIAVSDTTLLQFKAKCNSASQSCTVQKAFMRVTKIS